MAKTLNRIVIFVILITLILSSFTLSFASSNTYAIKCETLGMIKGSGSGVTDTYLASTPTRVQAALMYLRLKGLELEALTFVATESFTDANEAERFWRPVLAYLYAHPELGWVGNSKGEFNPYEKITGQAYTKVMLETLGYKQNIDFTWNEVFTFAAYVGLSKPLGPYDTNALCKSTIEALIATTAQGKVLIDTLIDEGIIEESNAIDANLFNPISELVVDSIRAQNLKVATITFSKDIDDDSVTAETLSISINNTEQRLGTSYVKDVEDNTLDIVFTTPLSEGDIVTIKVNGIKNLNGEVVKDFSYNVVATDRAEPSLISITAENAKTIVVKFSEPINYLEGSRVFDDLLIDGIKLVGTVSLSADKTELTYILNTALAPNTYEVTIDSVTDYATFKSITTTRHITIVEDKIAPFVISAKAPHMNEVIVIFSEVIDPTSGTITIDGHKYTIPKQTVDGATVTINLKNNPLVPSNAFIEVQCSYSGIKDIIGNEVDSDPLPTFIFKAPFDESAPTAVMSINDNNEIIVTFSETIKQFTTAEYTLVYADNEDVNVPINGQPKVNVNEDNSYIISLTNPNVDKESYLLTIKDVVDLSVIKNNIREKTVLIETKDKKAPIITGSVILDSTNDVLRLTFSETMDVISLSQNYNYLYNDQVLMIVDDVVIEPSLDAKSVDITIPGLAYGDEIRVLNIKDKSGTLISNFNQAITITNPDTFIASDIKATLVDTRTIELIATDHEFILVDPNDFVIMSGTTDSTTHYITKAFIDYQDRSKATLTLNTDLSTNATDGNNTMKLYVEGNNTIDTYNTPLTIDSNSAKLIVDGVAAMAKVNSPSAGTMTITFDEPVNATNFTLLKNDILLKDEDGKYVTLVDGTNISVTTGIDYSNFTILTITGLNNSEEYSIEIIPRSIKDLANPANTIEGLSLTKVIISK